MATSRTWQSAYAYTHAHLTRTQGACSFAFTITCPRQHVRMVGHFEEEEPSHTGHAHVSHATQSAMPHSQPCRTFTTSATQRIPGKRVKTHTHTRTHTHATLQVHGARP